MTRSDWISVAAGIVSLISAGLTVYAIYSGFSARQQDHEIQYLQSLEGKLYDAELARPKLLCFYGDAFVTDLACGEDDRKVTGVTAAYLSLAADFAVAIEEYQRRWCQNIDVTYTNDCKLYSEFLHDVSADPTGAFSRVRGSR